MFIMFCFPHCRGSTPTKLAIGPKYTKSMFGTGFMLALDRVMGILVCAHLRLLLWAPSVFARTPNNEGERVKMSFTFCL